MSNETPSVEPDDTDLDDFAAEFFGQNKVAPEPASSEVEEEDSQESDASQDTHEDGDEGEEADVTDDVTEDDGETDDEPKATPKKNRFQERIDEVVGKQREAERKLEAALAEINALKQTNEPEPVIKQVEDKSPTPDALNEDGTEKYPLGEFDPAYIKDLMRYTLDVEEASRAAQRETQEQERLIATQRAELQSNWDAKLAPAQERYPDFSEKGEALIGTFEGIDANYGEYLTQTLMSMEYGPDVLYYLANNVDEAAKIVNSGAQKATVALGRLEAKFALADEEKTKARPKVSNAAEPPKQLNRGSSVAGATVADDTDDLDAFSRKFFKRGGSS